MSHSAEYFRRVILSCCINFGYPKILDKRGGGVSIFSVENFLPNRAYNFRRGILSCCINFEYRKSMDKRGGGVSRYSVEKILFHSAEKIRRESFTVALISGTEKVWIGGGEGECRDIPSENFCLTVPIIFVGNPFLLH